jgi:hypothetical protein
VTGWRTGSLRVLPSAPVLSNRSNKVITNRTDPRDFRLANPSHVTDLHSLIHTISLTCALYPLCIPRHVFWVFLGGLGWGVRFKKPLFYRVIVNGSEWVEMPSKIKSQLLCQLSYRGNCRAERLQDAAAPSRLRKGSQKALVAPEIPLLRLLRLLAAIPRPGRWSGLSGDPPQSQRKRRLHSEPPEPN